MRVALPALIEGATILDPYVKRKGEGTVAVVQNNFLTIAHGVMPEDVAEEHRFRLGELGWRYDPSLAWHLEVGP